MSPERFRLAEEVFNEAVARAPAERAAFVASRCAEDRELREAVLALLCHDEAGGIEPDAAFRTAVRGVAESALGEAAAGPPTRVGRYRVLRRLGEGGFGVVYLAEQEQPRRTVALKLLRPEAASGDIARRFEYEARILARLRHPGIAQVYEAGMADAHLPRPDGGELVVRQPFIALEYVEGPNLVDFVAGRGGGRALSVFDRLELFARVCDALRHAHQNGVIHRDLKPDNILVACEPGTGGEGPSRLSGVHPKLLDFGVAQVREADPDLTVAATAAGRMVGTLAYMSPEQVSGDGQPIDTRSDVYSMGVVLYQVLSGELPYDVRGLPLDEAVRAIRTREAPPIRSLDRSLRADANAVVLRAIAKDRERRYGSIADLADDVRRLARGEAVAAKRDSGWYVVRKTVWRHRGVLGVGAAFLVLLAASSVVGWTLYGAAERARAESDVLLRESYLNQAIATRAGEGIGRRFETLSLLRRGADLRMGPDLVSEAIAALCLADFRAERTLKWQLPASARGLARIDRVALVEADGAIRVRDLESGDDIAVLRADEFHPERTCFDGSGRLLGATSSRGGETVLLVWRIPGTEPVFRRGVEAGTDFCFGGSEEAPWLAAAGPAQTVEVVAMPSGERISTLAVGSRPARIAGGREVAAVLAGGGREIGVFDARSGARVASLTAEASLRALCWNSEGSVLAAAGSDARVHRWNARTWEPLPPLSGHRADVADVLLGVGKAGVSAGWDGTVRVWDLGAGEQMFAPLRGYQLVGFDGGRLALHDGGGVRTWSLISQTPRMVLGMAGVMGPEATCDTDAGAERLVVAGAGGVQVWDLRTGRTMMLDDSPARNPMMVPGGIAALVGGALKVWDFGASWPEGAPPVRTVWRGPAWAWGSLHPDRASVVVLDQSAVRRVELATGAAEDLAPLARGMERPVVDASGRWLFYGAWGGGPARLIDLHSGRTVQTFEPTSVRGRFAPGGGFLAVGLPGSHVIIDLSRPTERRALNPGAGGTLDIAGASAFSPDGSIVACVTPPNAVWLADVRTGALLATLPNPEQYGIPDVHFSADGRWLMVLTLEETIIAWRLDVLGEQLEAAGLGW